MDAGKKRSFIFNGIKKSLFYSLIAAGILAIIGALYAFFTNKYLFQSIAYAYYYFGAFALILAVPQLYKRNEDSNITKIRRQNPLFGFQHKFSNPYAEKAIEESADEFKGEGFWFGIFIIMFSLSLFLYGIIMESIYFYIRG